MNSGTIERGNNPELLEVPADSTPFLLTDEARSDAFGPRSDDKPPRSYIEKTQDDWHEFMQDPRFRMALYVAAIALGMKIGITGQSFRGYEIYPKSDSPYPPKEEGEKRKISGEN